MNKLAALENNTLSKIQDSWNGGKPALNIYCAVVSACGAIHILCLVGAQQVAETLLFTNAPRKAAEKINASKEMCKHNERFCFARISEEGNTLHTFDRPQEFTRCIFCIKKKQKKTPNVTFLAVPSIIGLLLLYTA